MIWRGSKQLWWSKEHASHALSCYLLCSKMACGRNEAQELTLSWELEPRSTWPFWAENCSIQLVTTSASVNGIRRFIIVFTKSYYARDVNRLIQSSASHSSALIPILILSFHPSTHSFKVLWLKYYIYFLYTCRCLNSANMPERPFATN
jgi:hypothetical protein